MILRMTLCLLCFLSFSQAEDLEFCGFRKKELVLITIEDKKPVFSSFGNLEKVAKVSTRFVHCRILEVTPTHLKLKVYYDFTIPEEVRGEAEKEEIREKARTRRNWVTSFGKRSIDSIEGWVSDTNFPHPGPFDLW
jgi:hypothetical protein